MNTLKKGFIAPLFALIIILLIGGGAYVYTQNKSQSVIVEEKTTQATSQISVTTSIADLKIGEKIKSLTVSNLDISNFKSEGWFSVVFSGKLTLNGTYQNSPSIGESPDGDVCFEVATGDLSKLPAIKEVASEQSFCFQNVIFAKEQLQGNGIATIIIDDLTYGIAPKGGWRPNAKLISVLEKSAFTTVQTPDSVPRIDSLSASSGPVGATVILYGSFPLDTRITFDGYTVGKTAQDTNTFSLVIPSSVSSGDPSSGAGSPSQIIPINPGQHSISAWRISDKTSDASKSFMVTSL